MASFRESRPRTWGEVSPSVARVSSPPRSEPGRTLGVDEARIVCSGLFGEAGVEPSRSLPFGCVMDVVPCGPLHVMSFQWNGGYLSVPALRDVFIVSTASGGGAKVDIAGRDFATMPRRRGVLFSPRMRASMSSDAMYAGGCLTIDARALEAHWTVLTGDELRAPIVFQPSLDLETGPHATVVEIATALRREVMQPNASALLVATLRGALMTSLLTNVAHTATPLLAPAPPRIAPGQVRRAEEFIAGHAAEPITLSDIAGAAGVSVRSLQAAFHACRGVTPMERLRERRMLLARQALLDGAPGITVASVVTSLGLGDAGRFAVRYKQRFGESPSATLARGQAKRAE